MDGESRPLPRNPWQPSSAKMDVDETQDMEAEETVVEGSRSAYI